MCPGVGSGEGTNACGIMQYRREVSRGDICHAEQVRPNVNGSREYQRI